MTLKLQLVHLAWEGVAGSSGFDILLDGVKVSNAGPKARTTKILIPEGAEHRVTIKAQPSGLLQEAKFQWSSVGAAPPPPPPPTPTGRYTDVTFKNGKYYGEGVTTVFEAYQSDPRLSDWGGLGSDQYDDPTIIGRPGPGLTQDPNQRVHLFHPEDRGLPRNPANNSPWASWQELRTTDGPWEAGAGNTLAKATIRGTAAETFGPGGFSPGVVRWFAWDYLLPLNINGVSFEISNSFSVLGGLHDSGGTHGNPGMFDLSHYGASYPQHVEFANTPDQRSDGVPYLTANLLEVWNASGQRVTSAFNVWHEVVVGLKFAADGSGWQEVWHDGVQKLPRTNRANIGANEGGPYWMAQNYTNWPTSYVGGATRSAVVFGGFRAGLARSDVQTR